MKELIKIQTELKAPKNQHNNFGNYDFRSCEDILEALKPILLKHNCYLNISDEICLIGDRYYVKATAKIANSENQVVSVTSYAREPEVKKGMDEAQITGAASSYARKYALNGLFCIDDNRDSDITSTENQSEITNLNLKLKASAAAKIKKIKKEKVNEN